MTFFWASHPDRIESATALLVQPSLTRVYAESKRRAPNAALGTLPRAPNPFFPRRTVGQFLILTRLPESRSNYVFVSLGCHDIPLGFNQGSSRTPSNECPRQGVDWIIGCRVTATCVGYGRQCCRQRKRFDKVNGRRGVLLSPQRDSHQRLGCRQVRHQQATIREGVRDPCTPKSWSSA